MFTEQDAKKIENEGRNLLAVSFKLPLARVKVSTHVNGWKVYVFANVDLGKNCYLTWRTLDTLRAGFVSVFGVKDPDMKIKTYHGMQGIHTTLKIDLIVEKKGA